MIIKIKKTDRFSFENAEHIKSIENLLLGFGEGKHIILGPKKFFESIIQNNNFGYNTKIFSSEAGRAQIEYDSLLSHVSFYLELDFSVERKTYQWISEKDHEKITVSPDFFNDSKSVQKINVICENPVDADLYKVIATHYSKNINSQIRCPLMFEAINGGGGTTKNIFDRKVALKELTLCIIDNDRKHPRSAKGDTCRAFGKETHVGTGKVKIIDAHEVESLIPLETINEVVRKNGISDEKQKSLNFLEEITSFDETTKFYFDHKNGIDLNVAFNLDIKYGEYWIPIFRKSKIAEKENCLSHDSCTCTPPCFRIEGYGENLLSQTLEYINYGNVHSYKPRLTCKLKEQWDDIGKLFFSWCCAPAKRARM